MKLEEQLLNRSGHKCELCQSADTVKLFEVLPQSGNDADNCIMICDTCRTQIERKAELDSNHWRGLAEVMWSEVPGIQVVTWRMLHRLKQESWAMESLDMMYLPDEVLDWAKATGDHENDAAVELHKDCNGNLLQNGDAVTLIKSLDVKGSTLNAKMGTVVKNIRLVPDNTEQIEGKIEGQLIVILTKYVRKQ
ncbi:PhnA domain-containing protein [Chitinophaga nivalis]|uniref:PhnA domain-containing protein n=1 Tax=Chitinophaga nivalis TaxID=2991709 RepID=A0ABT3IGZ6_9BACT|nr:alkylphosphonate utilization protein [Chitinophaga nivalis]MCW3467087.1 PhnA domain-containing protein [Chitinophaga nivalis]MCW3483222.1 PhnA domain-containing protein [Chitinophaga nivalis]